jgi:4-aminobutyrate aminotransferase
MAVATFDCGRSSRQRIDDKERAQDLRDAIVDHAFTKGLLLLGAGENTIRICPPLVIDEEQAEYAVRVIEECIVEVTPAK